MVSTTDLGIQYPGATDPFNPATDFAALAASIKTGGGVPVPILRSALAAGSTTFQYTNIIDTTTPVYLRVNLLAADSMSNRFWNLGLLNGTTAQTFNYTYFQWAIQNGTAGVTNAGSSGTTVPLNGFNTGLTSQYVTVELFRHGSGLWFARSNYASNNGAGSSTSFGHSWINVTSALTNINGLQFSTAGGNTLSGTAARVSIERMYLA